MTRIDVFAPGCIGNIGPGLDILGLAVTGPGDCVGAEWGDEPGIVIVEPGHPDLPFDPARHTAGIAARAVMDRTGRLDRGLRLTVSKGLPLAGGQGGSAASAVAAAVAVDALCNSRLTRDQLLECCLAAEAAVAGRHLDNIAPSLLGGAVLVRALDPLEVVPLAVADGLHIVLAHPDQRLETRQGRAALPPAVSRETALHQAAQVAGIVAALASGDWSLLGRCIDDRIAEPVRAPLLPGFGAAKAAALGAGALGCSISGSGPTAFAFADSEETAAAVAVAMAAAYQRAGVGCATRLARVETRGARIIRRGDGVSSASPALRAEGEDLRRVFRARQGGPGPWASGVWRFRELVQPDVADPLAWPEGNTPLLERAAVQEWTGCSGLRLKHEGHNPTGSFKDRGMTVGITEARRLGVPAVACASTGNTAASMAGYAALAGIPALVLVPAGQVAVSKLGQALASGATVVQVRGDFDACLRLVREAEASLGVYLLNSVNPLRLSGQQTIVFELLEQLGWEAPDWIVFPAGNLGNTSAFGMALRQARARGLITRTPRLAAVQAAGADPFYRSFQEGFARRHRVRAETVATAIRIGDPASFELGVQAIRETEGVVARVTDDEILAAKRVVDGAGAGCEAASAAAVAGVRKLVAKGIVSPAARVVAVLTGHLLKDPLPAGPASAPIEIEPTLAELARVMAHPLQRTR